MIVTQILCNGCGKIGIQDSRKDSGTRGDYAGNLRHKLKFLGWKYIEKGGIDYCDACVECKGIK